MTTPETEKSDDKSSSEGESEEIKRGLVKLARKINKMLGQRGKSIEITFLKMLDDFFYDFVIIWVKNHNLGNMSGII